MSFQKQQFLKIFGDNKFDTEDSLELYFIENISTLLRIPSQRIINQFTTTSFDRTLSNICDVAIFSRTKKGQVIIAFELKIDSSVNKFSSYDEAKRQLHKYCQDLNCPYGILLSETVCHCFHYEYEDSKFHHTEIDYLPSLEDIENETLGLHEELEEIRRDKIEIRRDLEEHKIVSAQKSKLLKIIIFVLIVILLTGAGILFYYKGMTARSCEQIKGNITVKNGVETKIYHTKDSPSYGATQIDTSKGEKIFCTESEALNAGFRRWIEHK